MYWDTYCVLPTLRVIGLVSLKAPLCKSKCELPLSFWITCDFHACLTCTWNMFLLQKKSLFAYVLDNHMHFLLFLESKITYITKMWRQKFFAYYRDVCRLGRNQLQAAFWQNQGPSPPLHFIITLINAMLLLCIIKEPYTNHNHQNYFVMEVYRVLIKMFLFSSM